VGMRICLYGRVSTDRQETQNQITLLREFAFTQGWKIVREYVDVASGKSSDRQQFKALIAAAAKREFDLVLFWGLDRFSREGVFETLKHLQTLTGYGVGFRSFTEQYLDSCGMFRDAVISILAVIAKQERVRLAEPYGAALTHPASHIDHWIRLQRNGEVSKAMEYEEQPRGRVVYDGREQRFHLMADRCILRRRDVVAGIMEAMHLPDDTTLATDDHYRCFWCLQQIFNRERQHDEPDAE